MEYLQTPDSSAHAFTLPTPGTGNLGGPLPSDRQALRSSFQSLFSPGHGAGPGASAGLLQQPPTPAFVAHHFSVRSSASNYPGLTPFLGAVTPAFTSGAPALPAHFGLPGGGGSGPDTPVPPSPSTQQNVDDRSPPSAMVHLTSPFLQAAAKEAVRREFMNMPSYITSGADAVCTPPSLDQSSQDQQAKARRPSAEQTVPGNDHATSASAAAASSTIPGNGHASSTGKGSGTEHSIRSRNPSQASIQEPPQQQQQMQVPPMHYPYPPYPGMMYMPYPGMHSVPGMPQMPGMVLQPQKSDKDSTIPGTAEYMKAHGAGEDFRQYQGFAMQQQQAAQMQHHMPGMLVMGPNGPMMIPTSAYPPFPQAQPTSHMMMPSFPVQQSSAPTANAAATVAAAATAAVVARTPAQPETAARRKERVEEEKQDLIREFKKKTREAALVRFRQKRRERRFGKLIRYDCRKKLADARPRIKGRFVRVKDGEDDEEDYPLSPDMEMGSPAQVVPSLEDED